MSRWPCWRSPPACPRRGGSSGGGGLCVVVQLQRQLDWGMRVTACGNTASNWSTHKVPGATSDVCILTLATVNATPPISVRSLQVGEGASLLFRSGKVSIATSLTNQGFITLAGTTLSARSIGNSADGDIGSNGNSSVMSPAFSNTSTVDVGTGTLRLADNPVQLADGTLSGGSWLVSGATQRGAR